MARELGRIPRERVDALGPGQMLACELAEQPLLICRVGDSLYAVLDRCSHAAVPLRDGVLDGHEIECRFHGARFDVRDGRALCGPTRGGIPAFELIPDGDDFRVRERRGVRETA